MAKTFGSLFTGIAGLDLGLERAGWQPLWQSEIDPYACKVLKKHYPHVPNLGDVKQIDWSDVRRPDLVCGGFPCQPVSHAGARRGQDDERWLWPEVARCLRVLRPGWVLLENVPGLLTLGFGQVAGDLADLGYDLRWDCIPAAAVGAPHLRYRIFVVGHTGSQRGEAFRDTNAGDGRTLPPPAWGQPPRVSGSSHVAHTNGAGLKQRRRSGADGPQLTTVERGGQTVAHAAGRRRERGTDRPGAGWPEAIGREAGCDAKDSGRFLADAEVVGLGAGLRESRTRGLRRGRPGDSGSAGHAWAVEPDVGRVAHGIPARVDRLRCLGNAVVPQVAELVARMWLP